MAPQRLSTQNLQHCEGDKLSLPDFHYSQPQGGCLGGLIQRWSPLVAQEKVEGSETWGIPHTTADWGRKGHLREASLGMAFRNWERPQLVATSQWGLQLSTTFIIYKVDFSTRAWATTQSDNPWISAFGCSEQRRQPWGARLCLRTVRLWISVISYCCVFVMEQ